ncbi:MAG: hypothetical protein R2822_08880 [Spirosomataceae bacterium]
MVVGREIASASLLLCLITKVSKTIKPIKTKTMQTKNQPQMWDMSDDISTEQNPITLVSILNSRQHLEIAWRCYADSQYLFSIGRHKDYSNFLETTFRELFASEKFISLDSDTKAMQMNMAVRLMELWRL